MRALKISKQITNRKFTSIDKYLSDIHKYPLISADEEVELSKKIQNGDILALQKMVNANLRFVVSVAKQYQHYGLSLEDVINEGNVGLIKAANRFNPSFGFKFISYAVWWIRQSILDAISTQSRIVRIPLNRVSLINKLNKASSQLEQKLERYPSSDELAQILSIPEKEVDFTIKNSYRSASLDEPFETDEDRNLLDLLPSSLSKTSSPDFFLHSESLNADIQRALHKLSDKKAQILTLFFGLNGSNSMSLEDIAKVFQCTRERVRQIKEQALNDLRSYSLNGYNDYDF
ncbi:MAG: RNA polymerase sigma factor RpoD/SigA [Cytophagaceae bacterium]